VTILSAIMLGSAVLTEMRVLSNGYKDESFISDATRIFHGPIALSLIILLGGEDIFYSSAVRGL
jgi:hypothetical protein